MVPAVNVARILLAFIVLSPLSAASDSLDEPMGHTRWHLGRLSPLSATFASVFRGVLRGSVRLSDTVPRRITDVPSPYTHPRECGLPQKGWLCDPDFVMSAEGRIKAMDVMVATREQTSVNCPSGMKGFQPSMAIIREMHPADWWDGNKEATARHYAQEIGDRWMVGDPNCNNGIIVFLSLNDRVAYIKTAAESGRVLTDSLATTVVDNMKPLLRDRRYDDAMLLAMLQINDVLLGKTIPGEKEWGVVGDWIAGFIFFAVFGLFFCRVLIPIFCGLLTCLLMPFMWCLDSAIACWRRMVAGRMQRSAERDLRRVQEEVGRDEFDQTMCPICLEELRDPAALECGHRFHRGCIDPWIQSHGTCPLCRADVEAPLAPEDLEQPQEYQRRLRFYLSRLQRRHPSVFVGGTPDRPYYRRHPLNDIWIFQPYQLMHPPANDAGGYARSLQARYEAVTATSRGWQNSGLSSSTGHQSSSVSHVDGGFGGGGGFSGGGGGGGDW